MAFLLAPASVALQRPSPGAPIGPDVREKRIPLIQQVGPQFLRRPAPISSSVSIRGEAANGTRMHLDRETRERPSIVRIFEIDAPRTSVSLEPGEE